MVEDRVDGEPEGRRRNIPRLRQPRVPPPAPQLRRRRRAEDRRLGIRINLLPAMVHRRDGNCALERSEQRRLGHARLHPLEHSNARPDPCAGCAGETLLHGRSPPDVRAVSRNQPFPSRATSHLGRKAPHHTSDGGNNRHKVSCRLSRRANRNSSNVGYAHRGPRATSSALQRCFIWLIVSAPNYFAARLVLERLIKSLSARLRHLHVSRVSMTAATPGGKTNHIRCQSFSLLVVVCPPHPTPPPPPLPPPGRDQGVFSALCVGLLSCFLVPVSVGDARCSGAV